MIPKPEYAIFTDLDGSLLDHDTYSWEAARPALEAVRVRRIPLIFCSSKTWAEIEPLRSELRNTDPFITENGGGIFIPYEYFPQAIADSRRTGEYLRIEPGEPYPMLREALVEIREETGIAVRGYGDMTVREVAERTSLSVQEAERSRQRDYDEPFVIEAEESEHARVLSAIVARGLRWTRGGRFYHLSGNHDKGEAVRRVTRLYREIYRPIITIGIGDGPNDLSMLGAVDRPVVIQRRDGTYLETEVGNTARFDGIGPVGWNRAVLELIGGQR